MSEHLRDAWDELAGQIRLERARLSNELERQVREAVQDQATELSRMMHEAHATGVTWSEIRKQVKKQSDAEGFNWLRGLYNPGRVVDLRSRNQVGESRWDGSDFLFYRNGQEYRLENFQWDGQGFTWDTAEENDYAEYLDLRDDLLATLNAMENRGLKQTVRNF